MTWDGESRDRQRQLLDLLLRLELLVLRGSPVEPLHRTLASDGTRLLGADGAVVLLLEEERWELAASAGLRERDAGAITAVVVKLVSRLWRQAEQRFDIMSDAIMPFGTHITEQTQMSFVVIPEQGGDGTVNDDGGV